MAYLDLDHFTAAPVAARQQRAANKAAGFSALEWSVVAIAERDTLASLETPGRLSRALGGLFGRGTSSRLADPKLEALRRVAVHARHRGFALPVTEIQRFHDAGFNEEQLETLVVSVTGMRMTERNRRAAH